MSYCQKGRISNSTLSRHTHTFSAHLSLGGGTKQPRASAGEAAVKSLPVEDQGSLIGILAIHLQMSKVPTRTATLMQILSLLHTSLMSASPNPSGVSDLAVKPGKWHFPSGPMFTGPVHLPQGVRCAMFQVCYYVTSCLAFSTVLEDLGSLLSTYYIPFYQVSSNKAFHFCLFLMYSSVE